MKNVLAIIVLVLIAAGCASKKHVSKVEEQTQAVTRAVQGVKDSFAFDQLVDTSKQCQQVVSYERIEFYPQTYVCDSGISHRYDGANARQMVKSHTRYTRNDSKQQTGKAEVAIHSAHIDTSKASSGVISERKQETTDKTVKPYSGLWWLLALVILLGAVAAYIRFKVIS